MGSSSADARTTTTSGGGSFEQGKLFVGGIPWNTTEEKMRGYFKKYGDVTELIIMKERVTGNARGFGFVSFSDLSSADRAIQDKHVILGRTVEVKRAVPREEQHQHPNYQHHYHNYSQHQRIQSRRLSKSTSSTGGIQTRTKKIFVGGLSANLTEDKFRRYFEKFGRITDVVVMYDNVTHRSRGFGFITFDTEESVDNAMQNTFHELNGKAVEVKRAMPKEGNNKTNDDNNNGNGYNSRTGNGRHIFCNYHGGAYPPYSHGNFQGYGPPFSGYIYGTSGYGGGYVIGGYGGIGYGTPYLGPRSPWNGLGLVGARRSPVPYVPAALYPSHLNGGIGPYFGMATGGYRGLVGPENAKWNQIGYDLQTPADNRTAPSQVEGGGVG